jgi:transcriptional regulator with XRE-family HTH domain
MEVGKIIKRRRNELKLRQSDLAEISGVSTIMISKIESNHKSPTISLLAKLLDVLGMELKIDLKNNPR